VRANTCVACHQNVEADLPPRGHPELIFELDGQAVDGTQALAQSVGFARAASLAVGQAVALREMSWQLCGEK